MATNLFPQVVPRPCIPTDLNVHNKNTYILSMYISTATTAVHNKLNVGVSRGIVETDKGMETKKEKVIQTVHFVVSINSS